MDEAQYEQLYIRGFNLGFTAGKLEPEFYKETLAKATNLEWPFYKGMVAGNEEQLRQTELDRNPTIASNKEQLRQTILDKLNTNQNATHKNKPKLR